MASLFLSNALGCGTILLIAAWKRYRRRRAGGCQGSGALPILACDRRDLR